MPDLYVSEQKSTNGNAAKKGGNPLSAFFYLPKKAKFENQDDDEQVILLLRRHPITNLPWILLVISLALAPTLLNFFPELSILPGRFQLVTVVLWYLFTTAVFIQGALTWFFNVNIITNRRIVDVDFYTLIYREISDARLDNIQEITYKVGGLLGTFFHFGNVEIQTAGALPNFNFENVPNPAQVTNILQDLQRNKGNI
ncbi:MAG: hypothetical protein A2782_03920 [Candidatus Blackburnbacteria bacterium RIFCSPHIGHO2_01_FULL_43_15b]|uniref:NADH:quinone oxidoreductase/Mrp antiporter transmembrane domain-containing protein n=1 Tax=Candidatus Blackburnbacteria bacterium RIFCSPHIGHO2_01_FULL_43_15b TaxID=1797513 RepID=A0A1G1UYB5_9BACT|nr:MAG: hypothetical protein A2782_03920 [Candidatus Blackburnbacteria bacterium RIFCSPHIGHO2_01_FULL_43_15b]